MTTIMDEPGFEDRVAEFLAGIEAAAERLRSLADVPLVPEEPYDPTWPELAE